MKTFFLKLKSNPFLLWKKINFLSLHVAIKQKKILLPPPIFILFVLLFFVTNLKAQDCAYISNYSINGSNTSVSVIPGCSSLVVSFEVCTGSEIPVTGVKIQVDLPYFIQVIDAGNFQLISSDPENSVYEYTTTLEPEKCQQFLLTVDAGPMDPLKSAKAPIRFRAIPPIGLGCFYIIPEEYVTLIDPLAVPSNPSFPSFVLTNITGSASQITGLTCSNQKTSIMGLILNNTLYCDNNKDYCIKEDVLWMRPNAKIIVESGSSLTIDNTIVQGCQAVWDKIEVQDGATLIIKNNSLIRDAGIAAVTALSGSSIEASDSRFESNRIGIDIIGNINWFGCNNSIFSDATINRIGSKPDAGIRLNNAKNGINITSNATFEKSLYGIKAQNSIFAVGTCSFSNIGKHGVNAQKSTILSLAESKFDNMPEGVHTENTYSLIETNRFSNCTSYGVYASGAGQRIQVENNPSFTTCKTGIFTSKMNSILKDNVMDNVNIGIDTRDGSYFGGRVVTHNNIKASEIGINAFNCIFGRNENNTIEMEGNEKGTGISVNATAYDFFTNNKVTVKKGSYGIRMEHCYTSNISDSNPIEMHDTEAEAYGIYLGGGSEHTLNHNNIKGPGDGGFTESFGIYSSGSPESAITCNKVDKSEEGVTFLGQAPSTFQTNTMANHRIGLKVLQDSRMGKQLFHGNLWNGKYQSKAARNNDSNPLNSEFDIDSNVPDNNPSSVYANGKWFFSIPNGGTMYCKGGFTPPIRETGENPNIEFEEQVIKETFNPDSPYSDAIRWTATQHLYAKITSHPKLLGNELFNQFVEKNQYSTLGQLASVQQGLVQLSLKDTLFSTQNGLLLDTLQATMRFSMELARKITETSDNATKEALLIMQKAQLNQVDSLESSYEKAMTDAENGSEQYATKLLSFNKSINTSAIYDANEQQVNAIVLKRYLSHETTYDSLDTYQLYAIASQCPLEGGDAVYQARAQYRLVVPLASFSDATVCKLQKDEEEERIVAKSPTAVWDYVLSPNPANEYVVVSPLGDANNLPAYITITDAMGRIVQKATINENNTIIDIAQLYTGVYTFTSYFSNNIQANTKRLVVVK